MAHQSEEFHIRQPHAKENPFFLRMTPAGTIEVALLAGQCLFIGLYFTLPQSVCIGRSVSTGSVLTFLGVACPVCNKILLVIFGSERLLVYFEPIRVYVAAAGFLITGAALWLKFQHLILNPSNER